MILEISLRSWLSGPIAFRPVAYANIMAGKYQVGKRLTSLNLRNRKAEQGGGPRQTYSG